MKTCTFVCILFFYFFCPVLIKAQSEEFYGAFKSWVNLKEIYHAKGDGISDDTKAFQTALNELGQPNHPPVLFIPKGTYIISSTLTMQSMMGIAIVGEDPQTTIIKWNGKDGEKMFLLNGVSYSQYTRLTWDGNNKAAVGVAHEWDNKIKYANSGTEHSDEIFKNIGTGLKSGANMDAEFSIRRCRFYKCSSTGISLQGWNALDWWVWDCYFENCNAGVANNLPASGAGNFHVYRSIFKNSAFADIALGNSNYFSFRDNISFHSKRFIWASQGTNTSPITIQNNIIIADHNSFPIADLFTKGNVLFIDNKFVTPDSNKNFVINNSDSWGNTKPDFTLIGNSFTATKKIFNVWGGKVIDIDNKYGQTAPSLPSLNPKPFSPFIKYKMYEVNNKMSTDDIQLIINNAAKENKKIIIHFNYGEYNLTKSINIPNGSPLILYGDALQTSFTWKGPDAGPMIKINYPAKAVLRNLKMNGSNKADGILVYDNDMPGNTFYANEFIAYWGTQTNIFINGFSNTNFQFENLQHNYCNSGTSIKLIGTGSANSSLLKIFGCVSAVNNNSYSVDKGGRILVFDGWYEDAFKSQFLSLKGNGEFVLNGAKIANTNAAKTPFITIDSFTGKVTLTEIIYNSPHKSILFSNTSSTAKLLTLGTLNWSDSTNNIYAMKSNPNNYAHINNRFNIGKGSFSLPDSGDTSASFLKNMLATIRSTLVSAKVKYTDKNSHFTLDRVMIQNGINDLHVERIK